MKLLVRALAVLCFVVVGASQPAQAQTFGCNPPKANDIVCENSKPGNPSSEWDVSTGDAGDPTIQGFATDISVNQGGTIFFKINTPARAYAINIYRLGYYGGNGARKVATINPSAALPQNQPACLTNAAVGLVDCGNWTVSASWQVPANATSGIYIAHLVRSDTGGDSHIVFIVRNDSSHSAMLYQTSDETWQAYNGYNGSSFYGPSGEFDLANRAFKISYNRPFITRGFSSESATWVFGAEFALIQWLEQNGYDVTYFTGLDAARNGSLILNHKAYLTAGHDEYWSGPHRANVEAARNAGVNMAFFSGNEVFWKTRWENSIDGTNTPYRTLVCYKETLAGAKIDPSDPPTWTGTWRDPSFSPPADGGRPENSLTGTIFAVNGVGSDNDGTLSVLVPAADGKMRFWRNTAAASLSPGQTYQLPAQTLGYEWDIDADNGFRPAGAIPLSTTTRSLTSDLLLDNGATYGAGTATHRMMLYRAPSGALVFGAGTVDFAFGLSSNHDDAFGPAQPPDPNMQQAVVNLFADMGVQPATLQGGLIPAIASTDSTPPISIINVPAQNATITTGTPVTVSGTATDGGGGVVAGVEVSVDGGTTWRPASGRGTWNYSWTPSNLGTFPIKARAVDDSGNLEVPGAGTTVTVAPPDCPCSGWTSSTTPPQADSGDGSSVELGVKFRSDFDGYITGIRFYKSTLNTGSHIGNLWTLSGTLLGSATFTNETASGWQQVNFNTPVAITANTTYVASYFAPNGHYAASGSFFAAAAFDDPPIHLLKNGTDGPNGIFSYSSVSAFPTSSFNSANYWVDVVYLPAGTMPGAPPALLSNPSNLSFLAQVGAANPPSKPVSLYNEGSGSLSWTATTSAPWLILSASSGTAPYTLNVSINSAGLAAGTYTGTITINATGNIPKQTISVNLSVTNVLLSTAFATQGLQGWVTSPLGLGTAWSIVNQGSQYGVQYSGAGNSQIYAGNASWTDYTLNVPVRFSNTQNWPGGIRGRVNPATGAGYVLWLYPALGRIILYRGSVWDINQGLTQIGAGSAAFDTVNFHNVSLAFSGSQIQVFYDGNAVISVTDSTYKNGLIALEGDNQPFTFGDLQVTGPNPNTGTFSLSTNSLTYSANFGGPNPPAQTVQVNAVAGGPHAFTAVSNQSWLSVSPSGGTTPGTVQVSVNSSSLGGGSFSGTISVVSLGVTNSPQSINVNVTVTTPPPVITTSLPSLSFVAIAGQPAPTPQALAIMNGGFGSFGWTLSTDSSWLLVSPSSGTTPASVSVSVSSSGLAAGNYSGNLIISSAGVSNSPLSVPVSLQVLTPDLTEDFSNLANGWIISPMGNASGWSTSSNVYTFNGSGFSQSCAGNSGWTDYAFDTNIKLANLSNWPGGVRARVNPATGAGYAVWLYPGSNKVILYKIGAWYINDSSLVQLAQAANAFDSSSFHDLTVSFRGNIISVYWDGKFLMSAADSTYASGFVCLDTDNQPISYTNVRVAGIQNQPTLAATPSSIAFSVSPGASPAPQTVALNAGGAATTWKVTSNQPWLTATASTTLTPGVITATASPSGLAEGVYNGTLTVYAPGASNSPFAIPVTLAVKTALLSAAPTTRTFFGTASLNPLPQTFSVSNLGTGVLNWSASASSPWIGLSATTGTAPSTVTVSPNTSTLANGTYADTITLTSPDANNTASISVTTQVGTLLFSDNFSAGAGNWTVGPLGFASGWSVVNGTYTYNGGGHTQSWAGSSSWTDYTVATDFQLSSTNNYPGGLRGRVNPTTGASYGAWLYPAQGTIRLFRIGQWNIDSDNSLLATATGLVMDTNVHNLRLSFQGTTIKVFYDNVLVITATNTSYAQGAVALDVSNQPIAFSNVTVISLP